MKRQHQKNKPRTKTEKNKQTRTTTERTEKCITKRVNLMTSKIKAHNMHTPQMASNVCAPVWRTRPRQRSQEQKTVACVSHFRIDLILQFFCCSISALLFFPFSNEAEQIQAVPQYDMAKNCIYVLLRCAQNACFVNTIYSRMVKRQKGKKRMQRTTTKNQSNFSRNNVMRNNRQSERVRRFKSIQITQYLLSDVLSQSTFRQYWSSSSMPALPLPFYSMPWSIGGPLSL